MPATMGKIVNLSSLFTDIYLAIFLLNQDKKAQKWMLPTWRSRALRNINNFMPIVYFQALKFTLPCFFYAKQYDPPLLNI